LYVPRGVSCVVKKREGKFGKKEKEEILDVHVNPSLTSDCKLGVTMKEKKSGRTGATDVEVGAPMPAHSFPQRLRPKRLLTARPSGLLSPPLRKKNHPSCLPL